MEEKNSKKEVKTSYPVRTGVKAGLFNAMLRAAKERRESGKAAVA
jgi:hypothetical protein